MILILTRSLARAHGQEIGGCIHKSGQQRDGCGLLYNNDSAFRKAVRSTCTFTAGNESSTVNGGEDNFSRTAERRVRKDHCTRSE